VALAVLGMAALLATPCQLARHERSTARERARAFYDQGLDHWARGEEREMLRAMQAAWESDPSYLPPVVEVVRFYERHSLPARLRDVLDSLSRSDIPTRRCIEALLADLDGRYVQPVLDAANPECGWYTELLMGNRYGRDEAVVAQRLAARYPESPFLVNALLDERSSAAHWDSVYAVASRLTRAPTPPLLRAIGFTYLPRALHELRRHEDALEAERALEQFARESPPRVRYQALVGLQPLGHGAGVGAAQETQLAAHADSVWARYQAWQPTIIDEADPALAIMLRISAAWILLNSGDLAGSLASWDTLVAATDSHDHPGLRAEVRMLRGRTRVKLGDWGGAERDLLAARDLATRHTSLQTAYETEHNLLHLYEAQDRDAEARRAAERFVALTASGGLTPVRMMSRHDYGWFLQRRGEHEAARRHFEAMVADVDSLPATNDYPFFAGEYFEAIGDLDRAAAYYRRALAACSHCPRALEALAQLAEETGDASAATVNAQASDRHTVDMPYPEWRPLLPGVLARTGRIDEAVREFARAREQAYREGRAAGWARLSLELADVEAARGGLALATAIADSAAAAADRVADHETAVRARALSGWGRVRRGDPRAGLALLDLSLRQAQSARLPQVEADVRVLHGDALAALGRTPSALAEFGHAADLTDSIALSLALDPTRAGFRGATQLRVTNRALATIVAHPTAPAAARAYAEWSVRRKSRGTVGDDARVRLGDLQARLGPDHAVIDYVVLDTTVAALVVTNRAARAMRLPVTADILRARVAALHARMAPRVGSFVDRGRAAFDYDIARGLYADLLAPLEPVLEDRSRLTIVPDAPLHLVPFDALVIPDSAVAPMFVLDRYSVTLATSLSAGAHDSETLPAGEIVALSGPAPGGMPNVTEWEIAAIVDAMRGRTVRQFVGAAATEGAVRAHASGAAVLHFAAHARPNPHQPEYGRVTLFPASDDDGVLHVHEIRRLRLPGSLVVLSACESAAGRMVAGEGPLSLSRAFLQAGASGVVGTAWPVGEATTQLMGRFYREQAAGQSTADALRAAKQSLLHGADPSPLDWAAFSLVTRGP
jgi:CHAT domain-containing protein/Tfp pilus assembly protein PilF